MRGLFAVVLVAAACTKAPPASEQSVVTGSEAQQRASAHVVIETPRGDVPVTVEVVRSEPYLEQGLMYRTKLGAEDGMLFLMGEERDWSFWMKNTLIPLDMIFITKDLKVAGVVQNAEPQTLKLRNVDAISLYVLEVNGGYTASKGIFAGQRVRFEGTEAAAK